MCEFFINTHVVATKINVSWMARLTTLIVTSRGSELIVRQYGVFPVCMPTASVDTTIQLARKASQVRVKKAATYLLFLEQATVRKTRRRVVKGRATGYKKLTRRTWLQLPIGAAKILSKSFYR